MFSLKKYTPLFPTTHVACAVLIYFNWVGPTIDYFPRRSILRVLVLVGHGVLMSLMRYYPTFALDRRSSIRPEEFFSTGQGYFEAAVVGILGWVLNGIPCPPVIKYSVFLAALPAIHFLFTKRFNAETPELLHYPDVSRPFNPDE